MTGRDISDGEINTLWQAWSPSDVAQRMSTVTTPWYITAGWALELFTNAAAREHADLEIAVPAARFGEIVAAFPGFEWDVVGDGRVWPFPEQLANHFQTWLRDPTTGRYHIDVFREPHVGDRWVCRRDTSITLPYSEMILRTSDGIPYVIPEVALLFKAKHVRDKDQADFCARVTHDGPDKEVSTAQLAGPSAPQPPMDLRTRNPPVLTIPSTIPENGGL